MRDAMLVRPFVAAAYAGPHPERRGFEMRHGIGGYGEAGRKLGDIDAHPTPPCFAARLTERANRSISTWSLFMTLMCSGFVIRPSSQGGSSGRTPQAACTASGNFAAWAVDSTIFGIFESEVS